MPLKAPRPTLLTAITPTLALLLGLAPQGAEALGLGRPQVNSALGRPLDVSVPLNLAHGEQLTEACARAEVSAGEARVPAGLLQIRIEGEPGQQRIRLQSLVPIEEPALRIALALGCPLRLTREFNAFVDPPAGGAQAPAPVPAPAPLAVPAVVASEAVPPTATVAPAEPPRPAAKPRARPKPRPSGPRLVLERPEVLVQAPTVQAAASSPALEMTPELEAQITQLEQTVAQLRADLEARIQAEAAASAASHAPAAASAPVPAPAAPAPARASHQRDPLTWVLTLGLGLLAGVGAYQLSRWRDERRSRELAYWRAMQAAEGGGTAGVPSRQAPAPGMAPQVLTDAASLPDEGQHTVTRPQPRPMSWSPPPILTQPLPRPQPPVQSPVAEVMLATQPMPAQAATAPALAQELTIADELLDLRQQADFLQLLGQHEAAADLLSARLGTGPAAAMPLLMLMELCQQRGEPEAFTQFARRFEQQTGAIAPPWAQSLARGRGLDACPSVIAHLQVVWGDPPAAMQMLQELLARGGGPGVQQFELPAYGDLLLLYSVARDLFEAGQRSDVVDFMLPLDSQFGDSH
jgi:pilus assembly protein FimV